MTTLQTKLNLAVGSINPLDMRLMLKEIYATITAQEEIIKGLQNEIRDLSKDRSRLSKPVRADVSPSTV